MKKTLTLLALLPAFALAQGVQPQEAFSAYPWASFNPYGAGSSGALWLRLNSTGSRFSEDAGTVAHVYFDGRNNVLGYSEAVGSWTGSGITVTSDVATPGPFGEGTVDLLAATGTGSAGRSISQTAAVVDQGVAVVSAWVKPSGHDYVRIRNAGSVRAGNFNVATCAVLGQSAGTTATATAGTNGWCQIAISGAYTTSIGVNIYLSDAVGSETITMNAGDGVLLSRIAAENGRSTPGTYVPTTSAGIYSVPLDSKGNVWTVNGSPPAVQANVLPVTAASGAAGPFSDANYYEGTSAALWNWAGDWSVTVAMIVDAASGTQVFANQGTSNTGWACYANTTTASIFVYDGANKIVTVSAALIPGGLNIITCGRSGGNIYVKANAAAVSAPLGVGTMTSAGAQFPRIGRSGVAAQSASGTRIIEVIASTTAFSEALHDDRVRAYTGLLGTRGEVISLTRTTTRTCDVNGINWLVPAGMPCINPSGILVERASTNYALNSADISAWSVVGTVAVTADQGPANWTDLDLLTSTGTSDVRYVTSTAFTTTTGPFTAAAWVAASAATEVATVAYQSPTGNASGCTCARSDGGACTVTMSSANGYAYATVTTTPVRLSVTCSSTVTATTAIMWMHDGQYLSTFNQGVLFGRATLEAGSTPTSYIPVAGTAILRNADAVTVPTTGVAVPNPSRLCFDLTATPYGGRAGGGVAGVSGYIPRWIVYGSFGGFANSFEVYERDAGAYSLIGDTTDAALATRAATWTVSGWTAGTTHRLQLSLSGADTTLRGDLVTLASPGTGAGVGLVALGSPITLGLADGYLRDFRIYRSPTCR